MSRVLIKNLEIGYLTSMEVLMLILLFVAAGLFVAAFFNKPYKYNLMAAGLFAWVVTEIIPRL